jgi:hypothetical protein
MLLACILILLLASPVHAAYVANEPTQVYESNYLFKPAVSLANAGPDEVWCTRDWPPEEAKGRVIAPLHTETWYDFSGAIYCVSPGVAEVAVEVVESFDPKIAPWAKK